MLASLDLIRQRDIEDSIDSLRALDVRLESKFYRADTTPDGSMTISIAVLIEHDIAEIMLATPYRSVPLVNLEYDFYFQRITLDEYQVKFRYWQDQPIEHDWYTTGYLSHDEKCNFEQKMNQINWDNLKDFYVWGNDTPSYDARIIHIGSASNQFTTNILSEEVNPVHDRFFRNMYSLIMDRFSDEQSDVCKQILTHITNE
jgi:hypothetical protein